MDKTLISQKASTYLHKLCLELPSRRVGSQGNQGATDFFANAMASHGFQVETPRFDCLDWVQGEIHLAVHGETFKAHISPYTLGCDVRAPLVVVSILGELEVVDVAGKVLLVRGELAREQLMPKSFTFYNPDHHKQIVRLLEEKAPLAIIAATDRDPALAGGVYPFPLIEDGDFDIPCAYITAEEGARLADKAGQPVVLFMGAERLPSWGCNVIARKGSDQNRRVVVCAHIDDKDGSPGAIDNAAGVVVLLLLAELLADYSAQSGLEILAVNGEDYYSAPGEMRYLQDNAGKFGEILLAINLDGPGYLHGDTTYSLYDLPPDIEASIRDVFSARKGIVEGDQWYQSDHTVFIQQGTPAMAITSHHFFELFNDITHTPKDHPDIVDPVRLADLALALRDLVVQIT